MLIDVFRTLLSGGTVDLKSVLIEIAVVLFIIFGILPLHEFAHALIAKKLGDRTAEYQGRLTLNPLASIDPFGSLFLLLFGFGWAKPVPVNPMNFRKPRRDTALVSLAGPVSNLLAALVGGLIYNLLIVVIPTQLPYLVYLFFLYYISINISLAAFNFLPIPPLDGSKILGAFLPQKALNFFYRYQNVFVMVMFIVLFSGLLDTPLSYIRNAFFDGVMWVADLPFKLFGAF